MIVKMYNIPVEFEEIREYYDVIDCMYYDNDTDNLNIIGQFFGWETKDERIVSKG